MVTYNYNVDTLLYLLTAVTWEIYIPIYYLQNFYDRNIEFRVTNSESILVLGKIVSQQ